MTRLLPLLLPLPLLLLLGCSSPKVSTDLKVCQWTIIRTSTGVSIVEGEPEDSKLLRSSTEAQSRTQRMIHCKPFIGPRGEKGKTYDTARR